MSDLEHESCDERDLRVQLEEAVRLLRYLVDIGRRVSGPHWTCCTYGARNFLNTFEQEGDNDGIDRTTD
jgi:hypothetical protein